MAERVPVLLWVEVRMVGQGPYFTVHVVYDTHTFDCAGRWRGLENADRVAKHWARIVEGRVAYAWEPMKAWQVIRLPSVRTKLLGRAETLPFKAVKCAALALAAARRLYHLDLLHLFNRDARGHEKDAANLVYPRIDR